MTRPYLILVDGVLAKRKLTLAGAKQCVAKLVEKGYKLVSIAEEA